MMQEKLFIGKKSIPFANCRFIILYGGLFSFFM
jgi:hypothetical protein